MYMETREMINYNILVASSPCGAFMQIRNVYPTWSSPGTFVYFIKHTAPPDSAKCNAKKDNHRPAPFISVNWLLRTVFWEIHIAGGISKE